MEARREQGDDALTQQCAPKARSPRPSMLDAHVDFIAEQLRRYPDIHATRLHEELAEQRGFTGGYTIVRQYLKRVRPKPPRKPMEIVRTGQGKQGQADWSPYTLAGGDEIHAFSLVLSYSRYRYTHFCSDMRQPTLFRELRAAFADFEGVPEEIVFDSMKTVVNRWEFGEPILNLRALDFAAYYGFSYHIAPRYMGRYKGKVERRFRHMETSFFNARTFYTIEEACRVLVWWLEHKANGRPDRKTKRRPADLLAEEREHLLPLPQHPYDDRELAYRLVDERGYVHFDANFYLAQGATVGTWVYVRASENEVALFDGGAKKIVCHPRAPRGEQRYVPDPATVKRPRRMPIAELLRRFDAWGETALTFARRVRDTKHYAGVQLARILDLQQQWSSEDILAAIRHAMQYGAWDADALVRILRVKARPRTFEDLLAERARHQIRQSMAEAPVQQRGLDTYARLLARTDSGHTDDAPRKEDDDAPKGPDRQDT